MTDKSEDVEKAEVGLEEQLEEAKVQADKYLDMARRLQADFDNFRKRTQRENEEFRKYACSSIVGDLLTVVDDLDRARGVRTNLMKVLESNGLKEIPSEGKFDPEFHEALCTVDGDEDGLVAEVFQKGYTLNGKVLRYAKVKVTKKKAATEGEEKCQE